MKTVQTKFQIVKSERKESIWVVGNGALICYFGKDINIGVALEMLKIRDKKKPRTCRMVFRDSNFSSDSEKINILKTLELHGIKEVITV